MNLGAYLYHCVQGSKDLEYREQELQRLIKARGASSADVAQVRAMLAALDARRAAKAAAPPAPPKDPYWSLWGKLKARHERDLDHEREIDEVLEEGCSRTDYLAEEIAEQYQEDRAVLRLPTRGTVLDYDGRYLYVGGDGVRKAVRNAQHAVNTLRKLDTDDAYYRQVTGLTPQVSS